MSRQGFVTFSIDDGHPADLRTADLLEQYGLKATFYVPARNKERAIMPSSQICDLSRRFEIGAHTLNHVRLTALDRKEAWKEIYDGKQWLQNLIGKPVDAFCYPGGKFNRRIAEMVEEAEFLGARTCMLNLSHFPRGRFLHGVSTHACFYPSLVQIRHALLERNFSGAWNYVAIYGATTDWLQHFITTLKRVSKYGGVAHLFLHSWEIEERQEWTKLEAALKAAAGIRNLSRITNGELFAIPLHG